MTYNGYASYGNKLTSVSDAAYYSYSGYAPTGMFSYDANGNLISNGRKHFSYNSLNLLSNVSYYDNYMYFYDAEGRKLRKQTDNNIDYGMFDDIRYYNNGIETYWSYSQIDRLLDLIHHDEGVIRVSYGSDYKPVYTYEYFLKDHLGNTRVAFKRGTGETAIALQRSDYYPFGLRQTPYNPESDNKYLYNGKEIQDETGWYDYGARFYDASLGRWHAVDPLAEMYCSTSPYAYVGNNPIKFLDPDGRIWVDLHGNIVFENGAYTSHATSEHRAIGAALRETRTGRQQFDKLVNSENYVAINVEQVHKSRDGLENDAHRGRFNANQFRRDGEWSVGESSLANPYVIDLFLDGIRRYAKQQGVGFMEALAAVLGHEIEHNEDYNLELMQMWYNMPNPGSIPYEQRMHESIPHAIRQEIINQSKENNQPIRGSSWSDLHQFINANNLWDRVTVK